MSIQVINLAQDFTDAPGGRLYTDGEWSGEEFRDRLLEPAFNQVDRVIVNIDGIFGAPPSFFDEALGGLVRKYGLEKVRAKIQIEGADDPLMVERVRAHLEPQPVQR